MAMRDWFSAVMASPVSSGETPKVENTLTAWGDWGTSSSTWAGANVTTTSALQLLTVYGCAAFVADGISTLPVDQYEGIVEVTPEPWLVQPLPDLNFVDWAGQALSSLLLAGNNWNLHHRSGVNLIGLEPIDPTLVAPDKVAGRLVWRVNGETFTPFEVGHIGALSWPGSSVGLSPVEHAKQTIGTGMSAEEYAARFFGEDSTPPGVIELEGNSDEPSMKRMAQSWARAHSGKSKRRLPGVLEGGAKWKPTAVTNEQAQFLETRKFTASQIAAFMFRIDPAEMGLPVEGTSLTYANLRDRNERKVQVTFLPWIIRLEHYLTSLSKVGRFVKLNTNALLRADPKSRWETHKIAVDMGAETIEEVRDIEDLGPLPDKPPPPPALVEQIEALGQLIRAGFEPSAALAFLGMPDIEHTGLVPVTVKNEDDSPGGFA